MGKWYYLSKNINSTNIDKTSILVEFCFYNQNKIQKSKRVCVKYDIMN